MATLVGLLYKPPIMAYCSLGVEGKGRESREGKEGRKGRGSKEGREG